MGCMGQGMGVVESRAGEVKGVVRVKGGGRHGGSQRWGGGGLGMVAV